MAKTRRVLLLVHPYFRPDRGKARSATEKDVWTTLKKLGHQVAVAAVQEDLRDFESELQEHRPHIVFNLLEEFRSEAVYDFHLVSYLEALGVPYTGCNPRGLILSRHKTWAMAVAQASGVNAPRTCNLSTGGDLKVWPQIVKFNREHSSLGLTKKNIVKNKNERRIQIRRMKSLFAGEICAQEFIEGSELTVSVWGNGRPQSFQPWQLHLKKETDLATEKIKFNAEWRRAKGVRARRHVGRDGERLERACRRLYQDLDLSGYARFDFRLQKGTAYLIDVNANPNLARDEDFASSAKARGWSYDEIIEEILRLGFAYDPRR
jgi:D-alanine-D-alanine ligase